ncbi:MAG: DUF4331 domain-containing protein [Candidatus Dormibacteria bacterium]
MHKRTIAAAIAAISGFALAVPLTSLPAAASSHREAPTIATDPSADSTDVYAFTSPEKQDSVTLIANSYPFEIPAGGPNFYPFSDDVKYDIHVDNVGDAADHIVFSYTFTKHINSVTDQTFLYNTGLMTFNGSGYTNWNETETYNLDMTVNGTTTRIGSNVLVPPNNVGPHSVGTPTAYDALAKAAVTTLPNGVKTFAGQRTDGFFVDLGATFDLLGVNPAGGVNVLNGLNVNELAVQVPKSMLEGPSGDHVIGVWTTNSRKSIQTLSAGSKSSSGNYQQVSRLGNPLVNEAVVQLKYKDAFNAAAPAGDGALPAEFLNRVSDPELAKLFRALHLDDNAPQGAAFGTGGSERKDLETVFLTGIPGINKPKSSAAKPSEVLRLNMSTAVSTINPNAVNRMGVLGGQLDGFPNGRRPADDVVDIELQAVDGVLCQQGGPLQPASGSCRTGTVNPAFGDGVNAAQQPFQNCFPYLANPLGPNGSGTPVSTCPGAATFPATSAVRPSFTNVTLGIAALLVLAAVTGLVTYRRKANA